MLANNAPGNYRFAAMEGRPFSAAVVADEGYDVTRARFVHPIPLEAGLAAAARHVVRAGRSIRAITGFEIRIPEPLSTADFAAFNQRYVSRLTDIGLAADGLMPAARTNVAPIAGRVTEPCVYAVSYTVPGGRARPAFVLSGAPESAPGEPAAMLDSIMRALSARLDEIGAAWDDVTAIQLYGVDDLQDLLVNRVLTGAGTAAGHGIHWYPSLPPIEGLRLEIDARSSGVDLVLPVPAD